MRMYAQFHGSLVSHILSLE